MFPAPAQKYVKITSGNPPSGGTLPYTGNNSDGRGSFNIEYGISQADRDKATAHGWTIQLEVCLTVDPAIPGIFDEISAGCDRRNRLLTITGTVLAQPDIGDTLKGVVSQTRYVTLQVVWLDPTAHVILPEMVILTAPVPWVVNYQ